MIFLFLFSSRKKENILKQNYFAMSLKLRFKIIIISLLSTTFITAQKPLYKEPKQPVEARVQDLLKRMTPEEKFWQ
ncbi:MAG TPA: hypothetical protein DCQ50_11705, partial [Chryseobacterium sp.]|nr:hypothetical protein [Chryseobacterium sp.]